MPRGFVEETFRVPTGVGGWYTVRVVLGGPLADDAGPDADGPPRPRLTHHETGHVEVRGRGGGAPWWSAPVTGGVLVGRDPHAPAAAGRAPRAAVGAVLVQLGPWEYLYCGHVVRVFHLAERDVIEDLVAPFDRHAPADDAWPYAVGHRRVYLLRLWVSVPRAALRVGVDPYTQWFRGGLRAAGAEPLCAHPPLGPPAAARAAAAAAAAR